MSKTNKTEEVKQEKVMTKYDLKMQQRKEKEEKDKRDNLVSKIIAAVVAVVLIGAIVISVMISVNAKKQAISGVYAKVGEHEITALEYNFYYNTMISNYLNTYSAFLPYLGLDTTKDFSIQAYDENRTWKDVFDEMTVEQLKETKAMLDDAEAKGFVYETEAEDYASFQENFKKQAEAAGVSVSEYYKTMFGQYATESRIAPFVKESLHAGTYARKVMEDNRPTEDEITEKYEANKKDYDNVDYRMYSVLTNLTSESTDKEIQTAMAEALDKAETMKAERLAGADFQELCDQYNAQRAEELGTEETAEKETTENAEEESGEKNLIQGASYSAVVSLYADWVYDEARQPGDIEIFADETNHKYYVVEFVARTYNENTEKIISNQIATDRLNEYKAALAETYTVEDIAGELAYLSKPAIDETDAADETTGTDTPAGEEEVQAE